MNKTIFITGASSGIGRATAFKFARDGWNVAATMRSPEKETELNQLDNVKVYKLDVTKMEDIQLAVEHTLEDFGQIDVVLNNAAASSYGVFESFSTQEIAGLFETNLMGLIHVCHTVIPHFREKQSGTIINVSSLAGRVTYPLGTLYHGTKWAVEGFSESLIYEMESIGVKVKIIEPGAIDTPLLKAAFATLEKESPAPYESIKNSFQNVMGSMASVPSPVDVVVDTIVKAATDGSNQVRYIAGEDAKQAVAQRDSMDSESFIQGFRTLFLQ
ncbi:SDR family oxidoreductase [bacterium SCSIO 12741]|nr:SDR family oxidoreductase [bacterium SCSIO 12741]